MQLGAHNWLRN